MHRKMGFHFDENWQMMVDYYVHLTCILGNVIHSPQLNSGHFRFRLLFSMVSMEFIENNFFYFFVEILKLRMQGDAATSSTCIVQISIKNKFYPELKADFII